MKRFIFFIFVFFSVISCSHQDAYEASKKTSNDQIRVFGQVQYGQGDCSSKMQRKFRSYEGEILFITKSALQDVLKNPNFGYISEDGNIEFEKFVPYGVLSLVQSGKYTQYLLPGEYFVIPRTKTYLNNNVTFATGSVVLGRDFEFYECIK